MLHVWLFYERFLMILVLCDSSPEEKLVDCTEHLQGVNKYHDHEGNTISLHDEARSQVANIGLIPMYLYKVLSAKCLAGRTDQAMPVSRWQLLSFSYWVF
jgi:hypothetical protein